MAPMYKKKKQLNFKLVLKVEQLLEMHQNTQQSKSLECIL